MATDLGEESEPVLRNEDELAALLTEWEQVLITPVSVFRKPVSLLSKQESSALSEAQKGDTLFVLYDRAFLMDPPENRTDLNLSDEQVRNRVSAILSYNLALCSHQKGRHEITSKKERDLSKSRLLYANALDYISATFDDDPCSMLVKLSTLNNLGNLSGYFMDTEEESRCFEELGVALDDAAAHLRRITVRHTEEFEYFELSLLVSASIRAHTSHTSPAA